MEPASAAPASNMRVTFWGVQGTCPSFPSRADVEEYARHASIRAIQKTLTELADRAQRGALSAAVLESLASEREVSELQGRLGLAPLPLYGGETTCIEVTTAERNTLLFDMGSGLRDFSRHAAVHWGDRPRTLHVFASHQHLDHRNGLAFSEIFFDRQRPFEVYIYGSRQTLQALDDRYGIFSRTPSETMHVDDPIDYQILTARFAGVEIGGATDNPTAWKWSPPGKPIMIGSTAVTPFEVYHATTLCLGYKVQHGGSAFVFCTDHELRHGPDASDPRQARSLAAERRVIEHCRNVDLAYFDGQYLMSEYLGKTGIGAHPGVTRLDWGHSCIEDVVSRATQCGIRQTFVGHHDPDRPWPQRLELDHLLQRKWSDNPCKIELAKAGQTIEI